MKDQDIRKFLTDKMSDFEEERFLGGNLLKEAKHLQEDFLWFERKDLGEI